MLTSELNEQLLAMTKDFVEEETKPYKEKIEQLEEELRQWKEDYSDLEDENEQLNNDLSECDLLIEYIRELEKEVYIYRNKNLEVKTIVDELLYKVKCIKGDQQ